MLNRQGKREVDINDEVENIVISSNEDEERKNPKILPPDFNLVRKLIIGERLKVRF